MESAASQVDLLTPYPRTEPALGRSTFAGMNTVVLQADATVSRINGLAFLIGQRAEGASRRLAALDAEAAANEWSAETVIRARLAELRPRRSEIRGLSAAYVEAIAPGAVEAAHRIRRSGVTIELAGDIAAEALYGLAELLGVTPDAIHAPRLRFDALGALAGCDLSSVVTATPAGRRVYVGTQPWRERDPRDAFVRFTGVVAYEGNPTALMSIGTFAELVPLVA